MMLYLFELAKRLSRSMWNFCKIEWSNNTNGMYHSSQCINFVSLKYVIIKLFSFTLVSKILSQIVNNILENSFTYIRIHIKYSFVVWRTNYKICTVCCTKYEIIFKLCVQHWRFCQTNYSAKTNKTYIYCI